MHLTDLDSVMHVEQRANSHGWSRRTFHDSLDLNYECWVIVEPYTNGDTIAHAVLGFGVECAELYNISVDPTHQGRGIGRMLLNHMLERSRTEPIDRIYLEVRVSNRRAITLYESLGFKQVGYRKGYYRADAHSREDAYVLALRTYTRPVESDVDSNS